MPKERPHQLVYIQIFIMSSKKIVNGNWMPYVLEDMPATTYYFLSALTTTTIPLKALVWFW